MTYNKFVDELPCKLRDIDDVYDCLFSIMNILDALENKTCEFVKDADEYKEHFGNARSATSEVIALLEIEGDNI